jgi:hypothetical protein
MQLFLEGSINVTYCTLGFWQQFENNHCNHQVKHPYRLCHVQYWLGTNSRQLTDVASNTICHVKITTVDPYIATLNAVTASCTGSHPYILKSKGQRSAESNDNGKERINWFMQHTQIYLCLGLLLLSDNTSLYKFNISF